MHWNIEVTLAAVRTETADYGTADTEDVMSLARTAALAELADLAEMVDGIERGVRLTHVHRLDGPGTSRFITTVDVREKRYLAGSGSADRAVRVAVAEAVVHAPNPLPESWTSWMVDAVKLYADPDRQLYVDFDGGQG